MAVIEGHAEHVMDAVAPDLLPSLPKLRAALDRRRQLAVRARRGCSAKLLGLELKLRQYEQGKFFCDAIVRARRHRRARARVLRARGAADARRARPTRAWLRASARRPAGAALAHRAPAATELGMAPRAQGDGGPIARSQNCNRRPRAVYKHVFDNRKRTS